MNRRPHIIAAKTPSGAISQGSPTPESSAAGCGGEKTRRPSPFDETRRGIEAKLREGCRTKPREDRHVTVDDLDADLRIIGYGLAAGYLYVLVFRIAQVWS